MKWILCVLFLFVLNSRLCNCKIVSGTIDTTNTGENWVFLSRFCFVTEKGELSYNFIYPVEYATESVLLYYDEPDQWDAVYKTNTNCSYKYSKLSVQNNQVIGLDDLYTISSRHSGCQILDKNGYKFYNCTSTRTFRSSRERWWYIALSRCENKPGQNCSVKYSKLNIRNYQVIGLDDSNSFTASHSGCRILDKNGYKYYNCTGTRTFRSSRERWWYIALSRCFNKQGQPTGLKLDYTMHLTNGEPEDFLTYEFSADEFYILPVDIAFLLAYLIMLVLSILVAVHLRNRQLFHTTYKMYMVSLGLWTFHLLLLCIAYGRYGDSGYPQPKTILTARIFGAASLLTFLLMLILMAKGYTITRGRLSQQSSIKITVFMCLYIVVYCVLFIWEAELFDPGLVLYVYDSPPGYGLVVMRLIGWVWFLYALFFTLKNFPSKGCFYYPLFIFYTIWFWAGPLIIIIAQHALALWTREKTVNGVEHLIAFLGHVFFLILTRPGAANRNFPYHVRTSQIGAMTNGPETNQQQRTDESNPEYSNYSITCNNMVNGTGPDLTGLFVVSQTHTDRPEKEPRVANSNNFMNGSSENYPSSAVLQGRLPPLNAAPTAPPSYEALFTVRGPDTK